MFILENYWIYRELVETGRISIHVSDIDKNNWKMHENSVFNILLDGIEKEETRHMFITVIFNNNSSVELSLYDYWINLVFWYMQLAIDKPIQPKHLFIDEELTQKGLKNYIDKYFVIDNRKYIDVKRMNNIIDTSMHNLVKINDFSLYLANTLNLSDFLYLMDSDEEVTNIIHSNFSNIPLPDIKKTGMESMNRLIDIIKNNHPEHCLFPFIKSGEGLNKKQAKEVIVNIGTKPDGQGGIFPYQINTNYFMNGVNELIPFFMETSVARIAQIIINKNVGNSGYFSRLIGLNNLNSKLHEDPNYVCDTHPSNFQKIYVENIDMVNSMLDQYYRFEPYGVEYKIQKDNKNLVGKTIYKRSPMTCASAARGEGICYRCYGDLAYVVKNINIGKIAAEIMSSIIIQRMLSAKHLIEAEVVKMEWESIFNELFEIEYNLIKLIDDINYKGYKIRINLANKYMEDDEIDEYSDVFSSSVINEYINEFEIITPDGEVHKICTKNYDNIYITPELTSFIEDNSKKVIDDVFETSLSSIQDMSLFAIRLQNNDLTKALDKITNIIDKKSVTEKFDKNSILQEFLYAVQECGINVASSHCETLIMNQIRKQSNILEKPDWTIENQQDYQILTLKSSLSNNPSVTISLMFQDIKKMFANPLTYQKTSPGITDLFFMERPQEYMSEEYVEKLEEEQKCEYKQVITYK